MKLPKHSQLTLPLLNALSNQGRTAKDTAAILASELSLPDVVTHSEQERPDRGTVNLWERRVRWVRQTLVGAGMIANDRRNWWELTAKGRAFLVNCRPGVIITVFETENGMALWAEADPLAGSLKVGEVAERHGRKWLASEKSLVYLYGGRHRFSGGQWLGPVPTELTR